MKKILKITGITLLIIVLLLVAAPFVFQSQIKDMARNFINNSVNAKVEFADVSLSFLSSFPQANVTVDDLVITNFAPFEGETLASIKSLSFDMSVKELFKKADDAPIKINAIQLNETLLTLKTNTYGDVNWDIAKVTDATVTKPEDSKNNFTLDIESYGIKNSALTYLDEQANIKMYITELNHSGKGRFSETLSELVTHTEANVTFSMDSTEYLSNNRVKLEALIDLDLEHSKYTFKENKALINNLPIEFQGHIQLLENGQDIDITFQNPGSTFKDFLAVIPETYSKNISNVQTTGNFKINGKIKGQVTETTIPTLDIKILSNNASFKYPDLPKRVDNISIDASILNTTGTIDDTYVDIKTLNFRIDKDVFKASASLKNLTKNMLVNAQLDGILNLANISQAYPIALKNELKGIIKANVNTSFDMNAIETNAYERIKNTGRVELSDFVFASADIVNPIEIYRAEINFKPGTITLDNFKAKTGQSDLDATGTINNLLGFVLSDKKLKGNFNVTSNRFVVSDFMIEGGTNQPVNQSTEPATSLKIPAFLDCNITVNAKTVIYDNIKLTNVKGALALQDEQALLNEVSSDVFKGNLTMSGSIDTRNKTPKFNMDLGMKNFDIAESFNGLDMLKNIAPVANALQGKLNSAITLSGDLGNDFTPIMSTISGGALAELLTTKVEPKNAKLLSALNGALSFIDFDNLDLKDLQTSLKFENGQVHISPFNLSYKDIGITVDGSHGFDKTMNYNAVFNVPAKYLGSDVNRLIGKINDNEVNKISIPITASINGTFTNPKINTDLTSGVKNLTQQLIEIEKQKLISSGKDKIKDIIGNAIGGNSASTKDSTTTKNNAPIKEAIKDILSGNSGSGQNNTKDSTESTKNPVKDILNLFGKNRKKKQESEQITVKDTVY
ncbi:AsmA family protein [Bizionia saleffrena]|uniref:AsmA family protein n=1 Tax=Bizionia saleffrena TaxID=291189 RepID=A0A8H2LCB5_9FLAO|nr:AsmA-like C-terminal region-containing protein [Bizionia saleffrena]TYB73964.1 AsmA family protein [Bizionia saleffrena]